MYLDLSCSYMSLKTTCTQAPRQYQVFEILGISAFIIHINQHVGGWLALQPCRQQYDLRIPLSKECASTFYQLWYFAALVETDAGFKSTVPVAVDHALVPSIDQCSDSTGDDLIALPCRDQIGILSTHDILNTEIN